MTEPKTAPCRSCGAILEYIDERELDEDKTAICMKCFMDADVDMKFKKPVPIEDILNDNKEEFDDLVKRRREERK